MPLVASPPQAGAPQSPPATRPGARDRILEAAYALFTRHGVRAVGVDRVVAEAGIAKMTLYHHFASKNDLVLAYLDLRRERWTHDWLMAFIERTAPADRSIALFDALDDWFQEDDFRGCPIVRTLLEMPDSSDEVHEGAVHQLELIRQMIERHAGEGGAQTAEDLAHALQILMMGAIVSATRGDLGAARRARPLAEHLIESARG
jgi:AcrR family transcriptional regulator